MTQGRRTAAAPTLLLDLNHTLEFLHSAAHTRALAESCSLSWKTYDDSLFLNAIYTLMPWKERPGTVEMNLARKADVQDRYDFIYRRMVDVWLDKFEESPAEGVRYLTRLEQIREKDREHIAAVAADVQTLNREIVDELTSAVRTCARVKLASTIAVAALSGGASICATAGLGGVGAATASAAGLTNTAYSITTSLIKNWDNAPSAKLVGVSIEGGKALANAGIDHLADRSLAQAGAALTTNQQVLNHALTRLERCQTRFLNSVAGSRAGRRAAQGIQQSSARAATAAKSINQAKLSTKVASGVKVGAAVVFAAIDIIQGIDEYLEDVAD